MGFKKECRTFRWSSSEQLYLVHLTQHAGVRKIGHVDENIISRMTIEWSPQTFLVQVVSDKPNAATENE
jgi:hypothetical protein